MIHGDDDAKSERELDDDGGDVEPGDPQPHRHGPQQPRPGAWRLDVSDGGASVR